MRFAGHGVADELGPVCAPEDRVAATAALRDAADGADVLIAERLRSDWPPRLLGGRILSEDDSPVISLAAEGDWEAYLGARSANFRQQVRRRERKLQRSLDVRFRLADDPARLDADFDTLLALHRARWGEQSSAFSGARESFHREFAAVALSQGWLRLWLAESHGVPVAAWYGFRFAGVESYYQSGRDPEWDRHAVGAGILEHSIREAFADGMQEYRLLRGDESYKRRYASSPQSVRDGRARRDARGAARWCRASRCWPSAPAAAGSSPGSPAEARAFGPGRTRASSVPRDAKRRYIDVSTSLWNVRSPAEAGFVPRRWRRSTGTIRAVSFDALAHPVRLGLRALGQRPPVGERGVQDPTGRLWRERLEQQPVVGVVGEPQLVGVRRPHELKPLQADRKRALQRCLDDQPPRRHRPERRVKARFQSEVRAAVLERELKRDRSLVDAQEDQPQPAPRRGPVRDVGVELLRLRTRSDRGSGLLLPAPPLELERLAQAADVLVHVEPNAPVLAQPAPAASQIATQARAQALLVALPVAVEDDQRRALLRAHQRSVPVRMGAVAKPLHLTRQRAQEAERDLRHRCEQVGDQRRSGSLRSLEQSVLRRVPVTGRVDPAVSVHDRQHRVQPVARSRREDLEATPAERAPPGGDPARTQERRRADAIGKRVPRLATSLDLLH